MGEAETAVGRKLDLEANVMGDENPVSVALADQLGDLCDNLSVAGLTEVLAAPVVVIQFCAESVEFNRRSCVGDRPVIPSIWNGMRHVPHDHAGQISSRLLEDLQYAKALPLSRDRVVNGNRGSRLSLRESGRP